MKFLALILATVFFASSAFAASDDVQRKEAIKQISKVTGYDPKYQNCDTSDDCGTGMICVGIGLCVPAAKAKQFQSKLPELLKPKQPPR